MSAALAAVEQKVGRLLDMIEAGEAGPEVHERLAARRREREELVRRRDALGRAQRDADGPPTAEWVAEQLGRLGEVLSGSTPVAGAALRRLVGPVVVTEVNSEGHKRKHLRGTFTLRVAATLDPEGRAASASEPPTAGEAVTLDFAEPPPWEAVADAVKEMYDAGVRYEDVAARLRCPRSWPAKALAHWHRERDLEPPDGRTTRDRLGDNPAITDLAGRAKELWDRGLPMHEIAAALECCRDTATAAIRHWHTARNLPVPDGRARRKTLDRKSRSPIPDSRPE